MKKILNKVEPKHFYQVCPLCKCNFSYEEEDIELHSVLEGQCNTFVQYVTCPNCKLSIKHQHQYRNNIETLVL